MSGTNGSYNHGIIETDPIETSDSTPIKTNSNTKTETLKLYEAIIFSGPIVCTLIILFLFYFFYLRRHSLDLSSLRMRASTLASHHNHNLGVNEVGLKKEYREMLPVIIYKESFSVKDTQCSVCLGDYQAEDKLQQIPGCGHTFHLNCIDHWLTTHTTCPLCRLSLISSSKTPPASEVDSNNCTGRGIDNPTNGDDFIQQNSLQV